MLDEQGGQHSEEGEHLCIVVSVVVSVVVVCCASLPVAGSEELCSAGPIGIHPAVGQGLFRSSRPLACSLSGTCLSPSFSQGSLALVSPSLLVL